MDFNLTLVLKFDGQFRVKKCSTQFNYAYLVGFIKARWDRLNMNDVVLTYAVAGRGDGALGDDDEVAYMCSLAQQLSIDTIDINIKEKAVNVVQPIPNMTLAVADRAIDNVPRVGVVANGQGGYVADRTLMSASWAYLIKDVGQVFEGGAPEFRIALCKYSVELGFDFIYVKNERVRVTAVCEHRSTKNFMWRIHASIQKANGFFYIRKFEKHHTCGCSFGTASKRRLTSNIISELIVNDVRGKPDTTPKSVVVDTKTKYGFDISYYVAWRAVAAGKDHVFGDETSSYAFLPAYFEQLERSNEGTYYHMEVDYYSVKFKRCFFAIGACLAGFEYCRPTLSVDGTFLKAKHQGILLSAIGKDGDNGLFPVAFAVVNEESDSNWEYFFTHLRKVIGSDRTYTFLSDRCHGIVEGIKNIFPEHHHAYCLVHLQKNLRHKLSGFESSFRAAMICKFNACFYAATREEFDIKFADFVRVGGGPIRNFLAELPPNKWSCAYFDGVRYGEITSNAAESWNGKISLIRSLPITNLIDGIRSILMMWFCTRSDDAAHWNSELCYDLNIHVNNLIQQGRVWIARKSSDFVYEVLCDPEAVVDVQSKTCTCGQWQISGVLCAHAACVLFKASNLKYDGMDKRLHTEYYRKAYFKQINPFVQPRGDMDRSNVGAPDHHVRRGRPRTKRIPSRGESVARKMKCSRCNTLGNHNKKTCTAAIQ